MCETPANFLRLAEIDWIGLSTIATFSAVLVALFLPFYQEYRQNKNILALLNKELEDNYTRLANTENWKDQNINGQMISALLQKIAEAEHIKLKLWNEFKYRLAVYSPKEYGKFKRLNDVLERIIDYKNDYCSNNEPQRTRATKEIDKEMHSFISGYKEMSD